MDSDFSHLLVEFFNEAVENKRRSAEEGRPIYEDVEKVRIRIAGDPKFIHVAPAHDQSSVHGPSGTRLTYAQLHEGPYQAFKRNVEYIGDGTPLAELPFITVSKRKELQSLSIHTAEALAGLDGANLSRLGMNGRDLKDQAQAYIDQSKEAANVRALEKQIKELEEQVKQGAFKTKEAESDQESPFADWDKETIKLWIVEQGGEEPHSSCNLKTLIAKADALNKELEEKAA